MLNLCLEIDILTSSIPAANSRTKFSGAAKAFARLLYTIASARVLAWSSRISNSMFRLGQFREHLVHETRNRELNASECCLEINVIVVMLHRSEHHARQNTRPGKTLIRGAPPDNKKTPPPRSPPRRQKTSCRALTVNEWPRPPA